jgi:hypothetical protein
MLLCCERCRRAYHFSCVGVLEFDAIEEYICPVCTRASASAKGGAGALERELALRRLEEVAALAR